VLALVAGGPEPFPNRFLSIVKDIFTISVLALAAFHPVAVLGIVLAAQAGW
jgi:hypothetical protein